MKHMPKIFAAHFQATTSSSYVGNENGFSLSEILLGNHLENSREPKKLLPISAG